MKLYYGIDGNRINVTKQALASCLFNNILYVPSDMRVPLFGDPILGTHKLLFVHADDGTLLYSVDDTMPLIFDMLTSAPILIMTSAMSGFIDIEANVFKPSAEIFKPRDIIASLREIHSNLTIQWGSMEEEMIEQGMAMRFLTGSEKVLELGANIGRNSLVIASILKEPTNLVTLECDPVSVTKLAVNRETNHLPFHIEPSALSSRKLIQRGWDTIPSDVVLEGFVPINTITYTELMAKYQIPFDTLVADCEGALYYILIDAPQLLDNINLVIMENDYINPEHKEYVDSVLIARGFERVYSTGGGWGKYAHCFWETWALT
jgi:FkbM family methyltransferase